MMILADCHAHLYPCYDLERGLSACAANLAGLVPATSDVLLCACLTERFDCRFYRDLAGDGVRRAGLLTVTATERALRVERDGKMLLFILPGRQIITRERLEVLALTQDVQVQDGLPIRDVLALVREAGALAVLPWSPGKWFFGRGKIIRNLIESSDPADFALGDTALRPALYPMPELLRRGRELGFRILSGSDPLPFAGEESRLGRYASSFETDLTDPSSALRTANSFASRGSRLGPAALAFRLVKNARARRVA